MFVYLYLFQILFFDMKHKHNEKINVYPQIV